MRSLESSNRKTRFVASCLTRETVRHVNFWVLVLFAGNAWAQSASVTTTPASVFGPALSDTAGSQHFFQSGEVTSGAAQTQNGGGQCFTSNGFLSGLGPCSDGYVGKLNASGKLVFGTCLGGPTADTVNALAVDSDGNVFITGATGGSFPTTANAATIASTICM